VTINNLEDIDCTLSNFAPPVYSLNEVLYTSSYF